MKRLVSSPKFSPASSGSLQDLTRDVLGHTKKKHDISHPGMMGDGTEEQNLDERGNPAARIEEDELDAAFGNRKPKK
jgi:hypothetical protein